MTRLSNLFCSRFLLPLLYILLSSLAKMASPVLPTAHLTDAEWKDRKVALISGTIHRGRSSALELTSFFSLLFFFHLRFSFGRSFLSSSYLHSPLFQPGITGQDGSYLTELLLAKGYTVHGIIRRSSSFNTGRIEHLYRDQHEKPKMVSWRSTEPSLRGDGELDE